MESADDKVLYFPWRNGDANIVMLALDHPGATPQKVSGMPKIMEGVEKYSTLWKFDCLPRILRHSKLLEGGSTSLAGLALENASLRPSAWGAMELFLNMMWVAMALAALRSHRTAALRLR
jgi:hypothetical protein